MSKQYTKAKAIGNAGAFKFGEKITRMFGWPVRFVDESVDVGVDAEIEVCDLEGNATGQLIKAQIKSTEFNPDIGGQKLYLKPNDLEYLKNLTVPVIVVYVDISSHSGVYWRPLNHEQVSKRTPHRFDFSLEDCLLADSRERLEALTPLNRG